MSNTSNAELPINQPFDKEISKKKHHPILNPLVIMLLLFGLPYVFAWYFLDDDNSVLFESPNNRGQLVSPMIPMGDYTLRTLGGDNLGAQSFSGNWIILTVTDRCELTCQQTILTMRQARKSTGINRKVISPLVIATNDKALEPFDADLSQAFPKLQVVSADKDYISKLKSAHPELNNTIYMIDPYGNLMMTYPADTEQKGLMEDLARLLKVNKPKL